MIRERGIDRLVSTASRSPSESRQIEERLKHDPRKLRRELTEYEPLVGHARSAREHLTVGETPPPARRWR